MTEPRCTDCRWSRWAYIVVCDPFGTSEAQARMPALFCHRERPRERVAPDCFCPDFEQRQPQPEPPFGIPGQHKVAQAKRRAARQAR